MSQQLTNAQIIAASRPKYKKLKKLPQIEDTKESKQLLQLENKLARNLLAILRYMMKNELNNKDPTITIQKLKQKYGLFFVTAFRSSIEDIYRLGSTYALKIDNITPMLENFTTDRDLLLIRKYTKDYNTRLWLRIQKWIISRSPEASPIKGSFIVNTLAAELATFVMMESTKEKTKQLLALLRKDNPNPELQAETASAYGDLALKRLLEIRGYADIAEQLQFNVDATDEDFANDEENQQLAEQIEQRYVFVWRTAMDEKVCKKYCRPLNGTMWKMSEIDLIPPPDLLTHAFCRCRIIRAEYD